jgi:hypothetical protein
LGLLEMEDVIDNIYEREIMRMKGDNENEREIKR